MKNPILFLWLFFLSFILPSYVQAQNKASDAVYLSLSKEYTLHSDGSMDYRFSKKQKLLTYRSFHNLYGETFIVYHPEFEQLKINEVYTVMKDGKKVYGPANALNEILPGFAANAPAYNSLREMVVTHTGLERGATVNLDYQIHSQKGFYPALMGNELLSETEPIQELKIKIRIPQNKSLSYRVMNIPDVVERTTEGVFQVYTWIYTNLPAISTEESQRGGYALYPRLLFSSCGSLEEILATLVGEDAFRFEINEGIKNEVGHLKSENPDPVELLLKLQEKVVNDLRLYPIPLKLSGYHIRHAVETWNSNGGTPAEKMVLLTALLRHAGFSAEPVFIARSGIMDPREGNLCPLEDFAVKVELKEEGSIYLSPVFLQQQNLKETMPDRTFISIDKKGKPGFSKSGNPEFKAIIQATLICSSDPKITGEISVSLSGASNPFLGLLRDKKKIRDALTGSFSAADLKDLKIENSNSIMTFQSYILQAEKPFRQDSIFYFFSLPRLSNGIESLGIQSLSSKRETSFELNAKAEENLEFSMILPDNMMVITPLEKLSISNDAGNFILDLRLEKGKLRVKRSMKLKERIIRPEQYADFKALMDAWNNPRNREIVFRKRN